LIWGNGIDNQQLHTISGVPIMIKPKGPGLIDLPSLRNAPKAELVALEALTTIVELPAGMVLMHEGAFGNEVHILVEGELLVERDGEAVAVLTPGAVVGEQAVLLNLPRNASVTAGTDVRVAAMNRREFSTMLDQCPRLARTILNSARARAGSTAN
jgi:CRP/FNR family cyclic AMP-dependent transcriptional regulator